MLKVLVKKQLAEVFRSYFYNAKKNKMRSKWAIAGFFVFFAVVLVGMLGGIFTFLSLTLCDPLMQAGMGWLYFMLMSLIAIFLGAFGSVFNTYSGLYLSKDNDLLLSMPIPVRVIIASRLINVYLMGLMYSSTVLLPALIVYWVVAGVTAARVICGVALYLIITVVVLLLSCALGWAVARLSLRLKNKSFITVLLSLAFIGAYYFFYFRANEIIRDILENAVIYGEKIRGSAYVLYLFGRIGEGSWPAAAGFAAVTAALSVLVMAALSRSFLRIATAGEKTGRVRYTVKPLRQKPAFGALLAREFARFGGNANYMLNCGLGILLIPAFGGLLLVKGREICEVLDSVLSARPGSVAVLMVSALCLILSMNDMAAPSVSLEGKSLWILQSLPVRPRLALRAKLALQLILTLIPALFSAVCVAVTVPASEAVKLAAAAAPVACAAFLSEFSMAIGVKMPILNWTNDTAPIKQSGAVTIALFGGWVVGFVMGGVYLLIGYRIGAAAYLAAWTVIFTAAALALQRWLDTKGSRLFAGLS